MTLGNTKGLHDILRYFSAKLTAGKMANLVKISVHRLNMLNWYVLILTNVSAYHSSRHMKSSKAKNMNEKEKY